jgi:hypothetical protein
MQRMIEGVSDKADKARDAQSMQLAVRAEERVLRQTLRGLRQTEIRRPARWLGRTWSGKRSLTGMRLGRSRRSSADIWDGYDR